MYTAQVLVLGYSTKAQTQLGVHFVPFPGSSSSGNQVLGECAVPGGLCVSVTSLVPAAWLPRCGMSTIQVYHVSPLGISSLAVTSWEMSTVQDPRKTWLATGSLLTVWWKMLVSGAKIVAAPCLLALAVPCLPLCLWCWR